MHIAVFRVLRPTHERAAERLGRQYVLAFEDTRLSVLRSGTRRAASLHVEEFASHQELILNVTQKIKRRFYNGYVLIWWSKDFPLLPWIEQHDYPVEWQAISPPSIPLRLPFND